MDVIANNTKYASMYTTFLNIKGRMVADAFIIKPRMYYVLNTDSKIAKQLTKRTSIG